MGTYTYIFTEIERERKSLSHTPETNTIFQIKYINNNNNINNNQKIILHQISLWLMPNLEISEHKLYHNI